MFHELEKKQQEVESERLRIQQEHAQMLNNHNNASNAMTNDCQQKSEALVNLDHAQLVKEKSLREEHEKLKAMSLDLSKQQEQLNQREDEVAASQQQLQNEMSLLQQQQAELHEQELRLQDQQNQATVSAKAITKQKKGFGGSGSRDFASYFCHWKRLHGEKEKKD